MKKIFFAVGFFVLAISYDAMAIVDGCFEKNQCFVASDCFIEQENPQTFIWSFSWTKKYDLVCISETEKGDEIIEIDGLRDFPQLIDGIERNEHDAVQRCAEKVKRLKTLYNVCNSGSL